MLVIEYHSAVLCLGAVPCCVCETLMRYFIEKRQSRIEQYITNHSEKDDIT